MLQDRIALVTGSSRGIGRAIARNLAKSGVLVGIHYFEQRALALETAAAIEADGGRAFAIGGDLSIPASARQLMASFAKELNARGADKFDILVNNAGISGVGSIVDTDEGLFDRIIGIHLKAPFFLIREALPLLRDGGRIINISSLLGLRPSPGFVVYGAAKAAIHALTRSAAVDLGPRGITVNAIAPGPTATDMMNALPDGAAAVKSYEAATPLGRMGEPEDIARVVKFLSSAEGGWVTGQIILASGGMGL